MARIDAQVGRQFNGSVELGGRGPLTRVMASSSGYSQVVDFGERRIVFLAVFHTLSSSEFDIARRAGLSIATIAPGADGVECQTFDHLGSAQVSGRRS